MTKPQILKKKDLSKSIFPKITPQSISAYQQNLRQSGLSEATIKRRFSTLRRFQDWAKKEDYIQPTGLEKEEIIEVIKPEAKSKLGKFAKIGFSFASIIAITIILLKYFYPRPLQYLPPFFSSALIKEIALETPTPSPVPKGIETEKELPPEAEFPQEETGLTLDSKGYLILTGSTPKISASEGRLIIEGEEVIIQTLPTSDGNITLAPDGSGVLNLLFNTPTGQVINAIDANLGTSGQKKDNTLYYGYVGNDNTNYYLLKLESGSTPKTRFSLDALGNAIIGGDLTVEGDELTLQITDLTLTQPVSLDLAPSTQALNFESSLLNLDTINQEVEVEGHLQITGTATVTQEIYNLYNKPLKQGHEAVITKAGWYRIAQTTNRASGLFNVMDMTPDRHQSIYFYASVAYPDANNQRQLLFNLFSNVRHDQNVFSKARLVRKGENDPVYLEIYVESPSNNQVRYILSQNDWDSGWTPIDWETGQVPLGYTAIEYLIDNLHFGINENSLIVNEEGQVGIGTAGPNYPLDVNGTIQMTGFKMPTGATTDYVLTSDSKGVGTWTDVSSTGGPWTLVDPNLYPDSTSYNVAIGATDAGTAKLYVNGNVGIGTTNPSSFKLEVDGSIGPDSNDDHDLGSDSLRWQDLYLGPGSIHLGTSTTDEYTISYDTNSDFLGFNVNGSGNPEIVMDSSGNVGIGTTGPNYKLDVSSTLRTTGASWLGSGLTGQGLFVKSDGNVGIGTTSPSNKLSIAGGVGIGTTSPSSVYHTTGVAPDGGLIVEGNVGIGTTGPGAKLDINLSSTTMGQDTTAQRIVFSDSGGETSGNLIYEYGLYLDENISGNLSSVGSEQDSYGLFVNLESTSVLANDSNDQYQVLTGISALSRFSGTVGDSSDYVESMAIVVRSDGDMGTIGDTSHYGYYAAVGGTADENYGLYITSDGSATTNWGIYTTGEDKNYFAGNLGIGTTNPGNKLDVIGNLGLDNQGELRLYEPDGTGSDYTGFKAPSDVTGTIVYALPPADGSSNQVLATNNDGTLSWIDVSGGSGALWLDGGDYLYPDTTYASNVMVPSGNLGVGITSPSSKLSIAGGVGIGTTSPTSAYHSTATAPDGGLIVEGNVGIGTTGPDMKLSLEGSLTGSSSKFGIQIKNTSTGNDAYATINLFANTYSQLVFGDEAGTGAGQFLYAHSNSSLVFHNALSGPILFSAAHSNYLTGERMRITNTGNVGIGTTSPSNKLSIAGGVGIGTTSPSSVYHSVGVAPDGGLIVEGNVGIGTTGPGAKLDVAGNTILGASTSNTLTVNAYVNSDIIPDTGSQRDLGDNTRRWEYIFADNVNATSLIGTIVTGQTSSNDWLINSDNTTQDTEDATLSFERGAPAVNAEIRWDSTNKYLSTNAPAWVIEPDSGITYSGTAALIVNQIQDEDIFTASASGTPKFIITNAGNVAIGTTSPSNKLSVAGGVGIGTTSASSVYHTTGVAPDGGLIVEGNVGIGTTGPGYKLHVENNANSSTTLQILNTTSGTAAQAAIQVKSDSSKYIGFYKYSSTRTAYKTAGAGDGILYNSSGAGNITILNDYASGNINLTAGGASTAQMVINNSGNVGIGTTGPGNQLDVITGATTNSEFHLGEAVDEGGYLTTITDNQLVISAGAEYVSNLWTARATSASLVNLNAGEIMFYTNSGLTDGNTFTVSERMRIDSSGNVGIGTTGPAYLLEVEKDQNTGTIIGVDNNTTGTAAYSAVAALANSATGILYAFSSSYTSSGAFYADGVTLYADSGASGGLNLAAVHSSGVIRFLTGGTTEQVRIDNTGNVGIGTTSPSNKLSVAGGVGIGTTSASSVYHTTGVAPDGGLIVEGNVGIGTTSPASLLDVSGTAWLRGVSGGTSGLFVNSSGNVGIGTTNPSQKLHVEGQCVTGDTVLPVVPPSEEPFDNAQDTSEEGLTFVQIKDIKGGEYVLSLDETTGKIVPAKIKGLLDMGVKPIYRLTTEDGRTIGTTGNHPYLTTSRGGGFGSGRTAFIRKFESNISQKNNNQNQGSSNLGVGTENQEIIHFSKDLSNKTVNAKNTIPKDISLVNTTKASISDKSAKLGVTAAKPNQAAERLIDKPDKARSQGLEGVNNLIADNNSKYLTLLSKAKWTKVIYLHEGDEIAVQDEETITWQKIKSIEELPAEQVYDIEVEGTHNFVAGHWIEQSHSSAVTPRMVAPPAGGDSSEVAGTGGEQWFGGIIAHNTYLNSSATTGTGLDIDANSLTTGTGLDVSSTATAFNGELLTLTKTGASGSTAFTSDIVNLSYSQTFDGGVGLDSTGNVLDISRSITLNNAGNTHTISGALMTLADSGTQTAGTLTHTGNVLDITQNYTSSSGTVLYLKNYGGSSSTSFRVDDASGDTSPFLIDASGNVGIGTTGPSGKLDVGGISPTASLLVTGGSPTLSVGGSTVGRFLAQGSTQADLVLNDSGGNVDEKVFQMVIRDGTTLLRGLDDSTVGLTYNFLTLDMGSGNVAVGAVDPGTAKLYVNGNVGISTTAPSNKLSIAGGVGIGTTSPSSVYHTTGVAPDGGLIVEGNVGIGTTNPSEKLDVNGDLLLSGVLQAGGASSGLAYHQFGTGTKDEGSIADAEDVYISQDLEVDGVLYANQLATPYQQTVTVAKSGGDYTSIQGAIDSITDESSSKRYLVLIYPGQYNEAVTTTDYIDLMGVDRDSVYIYYSSTDINVPVVKLDSNVTLSNLWVENTAAAATSTLGINTYGVGPVTNSKIINCKVKGNWDAVYLNNSGDDVTFESSYFEGDFDAIGVGTGATARLFNNIIKYTSTYTSNAARAIVASGASTKVIAIGNLIDISKNASDTNSVYGAQIMTGASAFFIGNHFIVDHADASATAAGIGHYSTGTTYVTGNTFEVTASGGGSAYDLYSDGGGTIKLYNQAYDTLYKSATSTISTADTRFDDLYLTGSLGIGTTSPSEALHVAGDAYVTQDLHLTDTLYLGSIDNNTYIDYYGTDNLRMVAGGSDALFLESGGSVGIGTSSPSSKLSIAGGVGIGTTSPTSLYHTTAIAPDGGLIVEGNVGIGTTGPGAKLEVAGNIYLSKGADRTIKITQASSGNGNNLFLQAGQGVGTGGDGGNLYLDGGSGPAGGAKGNVFLATQATGLGGNRVGIGTTNPAQTLEVVGNIRLQIGSGTSSPVDVYIESDGDLTTSTSDLRAKTNLEELEPALDKVLQLKPYAFNWISNPDGKKDIGMLAQEVESIFPEIVFTNPNDGFMGINYSRLGTILTKAIQEQQETINSLSEKLAVIPEKVNSILETLTVTKKIISPLVETDTLVVNKKIISPLAETKRIETESISLREIDIKPAEGGFGELIIKGENQETVARIDSKGNASFAGKLEASQIRTEGFETQSATVAGRVKAASLETESAHVTGTLYAEEIVTKKGTFGELLTGILDTAVIKEANLTAIQTKLTDLEAQIQKEPTLPEEDEEEFDIDIEALVNQILADAQIESTDSASLDEYASIPIPNPENSVNIADGLTVFGPASLADTTISGSLSVDGTMNLANNSINTITGPIYLQNLGLGGIDILNGKVVIDEKGNTIFEGDVTVRGSLFAGILSPLPEKDLTIDLANNPEAEAEAEKESKFGKLLVKGVEGQTVASIDAEGTASFKKLVIASEETKAPSETGVITTNATTGKATLLAGEVEITIKSPFVTENTLVYITPASETKNKVLFVKAKKAVEFTSQELSNNTSEVAGTDSSDGELGWFKVAIDGPIDQEIEFNWWIIN